MCELATGKIKIELSYCFISRINIGIFKSIYKEVMNTREESLFERIAVASKEIGDILCGKLSLVCKIFR